MTATLQAEPGMVRVDGEDVKNKVMRALSNHSLRRILISCLNEPQAISQLSNSLNLPLSTVYNYVHELAEAGLLSVERTVITDEGKRHEMYRCVIKEIRTVVESDKVMVEILPNEDVVNRFYRRWLSLKEAK